MVDFYTCCTNGNRNKYSLGELQNLHLYHNCVSIIPVSIGTTSVKIHHETWELWPNIKWHVFLWTTVYIAC